MSSDEIVNGLTAATLEAKWRSNPDSEQRQNPFNLRMRRATSWLARAEQERDDPDAAFIFYWIAFNAAYAQHSRGLYDLVSKLYSETILRRCQTWIATPIVPSITQFG